MPFSKLAESIGKRVGGRGGGGMVFPVGGGGGSGGGGEEEAAVDGAGLIGRKFAKLCWLKEKKIDDGSGIDANNGDAPLEKPAGKEGGGEDLKERGKRVSIHAGGGWFSTLFGDDEEEEE